MTRQAVKALSENRVGGYLAIWGSASQKDLQGEYFTPETNFELGWYEKRPVLYQHGLDGTIKTAVVGEIVSIKADEVGLWAEAELWEDRQNALHTDYVRAIRNLVRKGLLSWSSGSLPHLVQVGKDGRISRWPVVEGSLTPTPAEPRRTNVQVVKSAYKALGLDTSALKLDEAGAPVGLADSGEAGQAIAEEGAVVDTAEVLNEIDLQADAPEPEPLPVMDAPEDPVAPKTEPIAAPDAPQANEDLPTEELAEPEAAPEDAPEPDGEEDVRRLSPMEQLEQILNVILEVLGYSEVTDEQRGEIMQQATSMLEQQIGSSMDAMKPENMKAAFANPHFRQDLTASIKGVMGSGIDASQIAEAFRSNSQAGAGGTSRLGGGTANATAPGAPAPRVGGMKTKYERAGLDAKDLAYWYTVNRLVARNQPGMSFPAEAYRELVVRAEDAVKSGAVELRYEDDPNGVKAMNVARSIEARAAAIKDNELNHTSNTGYGEEWIPDLWSSELWMDEREELVVAREFQQVDMPSDPFNLPVEGVDPAMQIVPETTNAAQLVYTDSATSTIQKIGTGSIQMTTDKFMLRIAISAEQEEDSIIPTLADARRKTLRVFDETRDSIILNGDNDTVGNVNLDGGTPDATAPYMVSSGDGLVKTAFTLAAAAVTLTPIIDAGGLPTLQLLRALRFQGLSREYRRQFTNLRYIVDGETEGKLLNIPEFLTVDKMGPAATVLTGQIGSIDGIPVLVSGELEPAASNGKVSSTAGNNTKGRAVLVYKPWHKVGFRRQVRITSEFIASMDAHLMVLSARMGQKQRTGNYVAMLRNITV